MEQPRYQRWLRQVYETQDEEIPCSELFEQIAQYVDRDQAFQVVERDGPVSRAGPVVEIHQRESRGHQGAGAPDASGQRTHQRQLRLGEQQPAEHHRKAKFAGPAWLGRHQRIDTEPSQASQSGRHVSVRQAAYVLECAERGLSLPLDGPASLLAGAIALLVLAFVYNRYQEKIREWL